jgi:hypothetical protein
MKRHRLRTAALGGFLVLGIAGLAAYAGRIPPSGVVWDAYYLYGPDSRWDQAPGPLLASGSDIIDNTDRLKSGVASLKPELQHSVPAGAAGQPALSDLGSIEQLKRLFNDAGGDARLILIVSPT